MNKIFSKIVSSLPQILALLFIIGFAVYAWTEPTQTPPGGNVETPINVGTTPQSKIGRFSATEFYDYNDPAYYLNPSGQSVLQNLCFSGDCRSIWPSGTITGVTAGTGLTGGGTSGNVTLNLGSLYKRSIDLLLPPGVYSDTIRPGSASCPAGEYVCGITIYGQPYAYDYTLQLQCCGK